MFRTVLLATLLPAALLAQLSTAELSGRVTDPSGAIVPAAELTLRNVETGVERHALSNESGYYTFTLLPPGRYSISAAKPGFVVVTNPGITLQVDQRSRVDFELKVGQVSETVNVEAVGVEVQSSSSELGSVVPEKQVLDLPLNGRNFTQLLTLTPGASPISTGQNRNGGQVSSVGSVTYPSINGQTNRSNMFMTDGVNNLGVFQGTYAVPPIVDSIQEFKVQSHNDLAEVGSVTGGVVNVVTRSGTNEFHGTLWEFIRNDLLDARDTFRPAVLPLRQHMFGATTGGRIVRNRTFFHLAWQSFRNRTPSNSLYRVPTEANLRGDFGDWPRQIFDPFTTRADASAAGRLIRTPFAGNQIPASRLDQGFLAFARETLPPPIATGVADRNQLDLTPTRQDQEEYSARFDHTVSERDMIWGRISGQFFRQTGSGNRQTLPATNDIETISIGASWVHTFSPNSILQTQYGHVVAERTAGNSFVNGGLPLAKTIGFNEEYCCAFRSGRALVPNINVNQFFGGGERFDFSRPTDLDQYKSTWSLIRGNHTFKAGGEFNHLRFRNAVNDHDVTFDNTPTADPANLGATGSPVASWLLNVPISAARRDFFKSTRFGGIMGFFVQDSWKVTSRLTVNLGFRYDRTFIPPVGKRDNNTIFMGDYDMIRGVYVLQAVPGTCAALGRAPCIPSPDGSLPANVVVDPREKLLHDWTDNYQPRLGLAYRLTQRTAVRAGFGLFYDSWAAVTQMAQNLGHTWPDVGRRLSPNINAPTPAQPTPTVSGKNPFPSATLPGATPFNDGAVFADPFFRNARSVQWNGGVQHQFSADMLLSVNYAGSANTRTSMGGNYNVARTPGPGNPAERRPFPYITPTNWDRSWGRANYHGLQSQFSKRFSRGLTYTVNYTWSKAINTVCDGFFNAEGCSAQDPYNFNRERSVAGHDVPHILNVSWLYDLPFRASSRAVNAVISGWQINGIATFHSAPPFTVNINGDIANTGNASGYMRPNVVGEARIEDPTTSRWFHTAAFATPARFSFGNAGRNILRSHGARNVDLSLFREIPLRWREGMAVQLRLESFNAFNTVRYAAPVANLSNSNFGRVLATANTPRQFQYGVKLVF